jgi:hypothetical protein
MKDTIRNLSESQIVAFKDSPVWQEFIRTITDRIKVIHSENDRLETPWEKVLYNRGAVFELTYMTCLPDLMLSDLKAELERDKNAR